MSANAALLNCPVCCSDGSFSSIETLRNRLLHIKAKIILCPVCQEEIIGLDNLIKHLYGYLKRQSGASNTRACNSQDSQETSKCELLPKHKNKMSQKDVKSSNNFNNCDEKNANFDLIKLEQSHKIKNKIDPFVTSVTSVKVNNIKSDFDCNICGLQFLDENILNMHLSLIHNIESSASTSHAITNYQCHLCTKSFKMRGSLMVHFRVAHFGFLSGHSISDAKNDLKNITNSLDSNGHETMDSGQKGENKQWKCNVCQKYFTTKYFLKKHNRLHTGETPYSCSQCNKTFTFQQSYHKHLLYHNDEKPHCCNVCGRAFKELSTLHNHQRIHTGEKPFSCEMCGKSFRQRVSYLVHKRIHTGAMPYKCTACNKSFRYKVSQRTHKCQVQPPGTVIRQSGELIEKLKRKKAVSATETHISYPTPQNGTLAFDETSNIHAEMVKTSAKLSFEDTECEDFNLFGDDPSYDRETDAMHSTFSNQNVRMFNETNIDELIDAIPYIEVNDTPSPADILKNLCLAQDDMII